MGKYSVLETINGIEYIFDSKAFKRNIEIYISNKLPDYNKKTLYEKIANKAYVTTDAVKKWCQGKNGPQDLERLKSIAQVLNVDYQKLLKPHERIPEMTPDHYMYKDFFETEDTSSINFTTIKFMDMLKILAAKSLNGYIGFSQIKATDDCCYDDRIIYDDTKASNTDEYGIVLDYLVDSLHHDIISTYDNYCGWNNQYTVRVVFDEDTHLPFINIKTSNPEIYIYIEDGDWHTY